MTDLEVNGKCPGQRVARQSVEENANRVMPESLVRSQRRQNSPFERNAVEVQPQVVVRLAEMFDHFVHHKRQIRETRNHRLKERSLKECFVFGTHVKGFGFF